MGSFVWGKYMQLHILEQEWSKRVLLYHESKSSQAVDRVSSNTS